MHGLPNSRDRASDICVICTTAPATTDEHIPAKLFFDKPLPNNLITVPSCAPCNNGSQKDDEYLRAFLMSLRDSTSSEAMERVRERTMRQLDRPSLSDGSGLRGFLQRLTEFRLVGRTPDGQPVLGPFTRPDSARLRNVITKYARGLHFWSTGSVLPANALPSIERIFNMENSPAEYWEPMLAAAKYARAGTVTTIGTQPEFKLSFHAVPKGDALSVMVLDFYGSFPYVAVMMKPGTDFSKPLLLPY